MAFMDDIWCISSPERTAVGFTATQEELLTTVIRVNDGWTSPSGDGSFDSGGTGGVDALGFRGSVVRV